MSASFDAGDSWSSFAACRWAGHAVQNSSASDGYQVQSNAAGKTNDSGDSCGCAVGCLLTCHVACPHSCGACSCFCGLHPGIHVLAGACREEARQPLLAAKVLAVALELDEMVGEALEVERVQPHLAHHLVLDDPAHTCPRPPTATRRWQPASVPTPAQLTASARGRLARQREGEQFVLGCVPSLPLAEVGAEVAWALPTQAPAQVHATTDNWQAVRATLAQGFH